MTTTILHGDNRHILPTLPERSVQTVVTSPPYFGLRDYGADGQIGLEATPAAYVAALVAVFREVRRVLRDDGTLWLNLGDSYTRNGGEQGGGNRELMHLEGKQQRMCRIPEGLALGEKQLLGIPWRVAFALQDDGWVLRSDIIWSKPNAMPESVKDRPTKAHEYLFMFSKGQWVGPERGRYAHISDQDARWLALFFDTEGNIVVRRENAQGNSSARHSAQIGISSSHRGILEAAQQIVGDGTILERKGTNVPMYYLQWSNKKAADLLRRLYPFFIVKQRQARCAIYLESRKEVRGHHFQLPADEVDMRERVWKAMKELNHFGTPDIAWIPEPKFGRWVSPRYYYNAEAIAEQAAESTLERAVYGVNPSPKTRALEADGTHGKNGRLTNYTMTTRNRRTVWTVATRPYSGAHFAVMPEALVEPCVLAGSRPGDVVLDPFGGSGTVARVAERLQRDAVLIELNPSYIELAERRTDGVQVSLLTEGY